jgi:predicted house-cleaning noncanonical NTP pyrophosphatase (MazG superfamily)
MRLRFRVGKLIRDGMPAIMRAQGLTTFERRLDDAEFVDRLKAKLVEEAAEAQQAGSRAELIDELADLREVTVALLEVSGVNEAEVEARRVAKRAARGGFDGRIFNEAVEGDASSEGAAYHLARPQQYPQDVG